MLPSGGTVRPITRWGEPVMHRAQEPVVGFDDALRELAADMVATMYAADGVGLAACQIGVDRSIFVFDCPDENGSMVQGLVCNPVLHLPEGKERQLDDGDEGCLSFPGRVRPCARPDYAEVGARGSTGPRSGTPGPGCWPGACSTRRTTATGTVFGDRLPRRSYKKLAKQHEAATAEFPPGWPAGD